MISTTMKINRKTRKRRGKCRSPAPLHGRIAICRARRPRNIKWELKNWRKSEEGRKLEQ
jgi:hypothetical protein